MALIDFVLAAKKKKKKKKKQIRRFYGKIPGIWLPVHLSLFYGRLLVEHFIEIKIMVGLC